jgi:cell filamentation protein
MYDAIADPYTYENSTVLVNKLDLREQAELDAFEAEISAARALEALPEGELDFKHFKAVHHHLFQDVYEWAGQIRIVRISKGGNPFCFPENIDGQAAKLFDNLRQTDFLRYLVAQAFSVKAAHFLAELNAIHAFREGNGRTQLTFFTLLAPTGQVVLSICTNSCPMKCWKR